MAGKTDGGSLARILLTKSCTDESSQICGTAVSMVTFCEAQQKIKQHTDKSYKDEMKYRDAKRYWEKMNIQANKRGQLEEVRPRSLTPDVWNIFSVLTFQHFSD